MNILGHPYLPDCDEMYHYCFMQVIWSAQVMFWDTLTSLIVMKCTIILCR
jgi:hypothetical protein